MTDIPEDIETKAGRIVDEWTHGLFGLADLQEDIALAILAERERCAQIALRNVEFWKANPTAAIPAISEGFIRCAEDIASAIRSPERAGE